MEVKFTVNMGSKIEKKRAAYKFDSQDNCKQAPEAIIYLLKKNPQK